MPKSAVALVLCLGLQANATPQTPTIEGAGPKASRTAITVKFDFAGRKVEEQFGATPYVEGKTVSIFPGEEFGISVSTTQMKSRRSGTNQTSKKQM